MNDCADIDKKISDWDRNISDSASGVMTLWRYTNMLIIIIIIIIIIIRR